MAIQKKNGLWYAVVYTGTKNGKQQQENSKGFEKRDDAILAELVLKKSVIENGRKVNDKESLNFIAERWLGVREKTIATVTYRNNKYYYEHYIKNYFDKKLIKDIEPIAITDFMLSLNKAPATINKTMNILKQIFDFALSLHYIRSNPCIGVRKPNIKRKKKVTWSPQQIKKFLSIKEVQNQTCYMAFLILFTTGMRPGEVCGLKWRDWQGDYFTPGVGIDDKREETDLKNENAHDNVYIDDNIKNNLERLHKAQKALYFEQGIQLTDDCFINCFPPDMRPMTVNYLRQRFEKLSKKYSFPKTSLYAASRHSFGTNLMRMKANPKIVSQMMRHSSVRTTLDNYSHVDEEMYKDALKMYNDLII